jgi:hypothetical protein
MRGRAVAALCSGALLLLPGCGNSDKGKPIPAQTSNRLVALIGLADARNQAGECLSAAAKVREAQTIQIPSYVDSKVRQGIADGLDHLLSLIQTQCQRPQSTQTQTTPTVTETTPTTTTPTTTTPTVTTPTTTTPTVTTPTTTTPTTTTPTTTTGTSTGNGGTPTSTGTNGTAPGAGQG